MVCSTRAINCILVIHNKYRHQEQIISTQNKQLISHQNWKLNNRGALLWIINTIGYEGAGFECNQMLVHSMEQDLKFESYGYMGLIYALVVRLNSFSTLLMTAWSCFCSA